MTILIENDIIGDNHIVLGKILDSISLRLIRISYEYAWTALRLELRSSMHLGMNECGTTKNT